MDGSVTSLAVAFETVVSALETPLIVRSRSHDEVVPPDTERTESVEDTRRTDELACALASARESARAMGFGGIAVIVESAPPGWMSSVSSCLAVFWEVVGPETDARDFPSSNHGGIQLGVDTWNSAQFLPCLFFAKLRLRSSSGLSDPLLARFVPSPSTPTELLRAVCAARPRAAVLALVGEAGCTRDVERCDARGAALTGRVASTGCPGDGLNSGF